MSVQALQLPRKNECMHGTNLQPGVFWENALNDKGSELWMRMPISQRIVPSGAKRMDYDIIGYMLLKTL